MKIYVAPPKGEIEKQTFEDWLILHGFQPVWLDLRYKTIDGPLLLCGGADIGKNPDRDAKEFNWITMALEADQPIIGICRGMQILNVYFGGQVEDLTDILTEDHRNDDFSDDEDHSSRLSQFHYIKDLNETVIRVNSRHHQWCSKIADNFKVTHISFPIGYIPEAIEDVNKKIWAVQWHPERQESDDNQHPLNKLRTN